MVVQSRCCSWKASQIANVGISIVKNNMHSNKEDPLVRGCAVTWYRDALNCSISKWPKFLLLVYWQFANHVGAYHHPRQWTAYYICKRAWAQNSITNVKADQHERRGRSNHVQVSYKAMAPNVKKTAWHYGVVQRNRHRVVVYFYSSYCIKKQTNQR